MKFYGYFRSSAAYRCRIAFNLKGIAPEFQSIHLRKGGGEQKEESYRSLNPQALVPTLDNDGVLLTQSLAIIEWLDESYPGARLVPENKEQRALVRAFALAIACDVHPLQNLRVLDYLRTEFRADQAALDKWCQRWIGDGLAACEEIVSRAPSKTRFCFGDEPSLVDLCLVPQMFSAERFRLDTASYPNLERITQACNSLPAFHDAHPSRQPDSEA